jgi:hypothetical protein
MEAGKAQGDPTFLEIFQICWVLSWRIVYFTDIF